MNKPQLDWVESGPAEYAVSGRTDIKYVVFLGQGHIVWCLALGHATESFRGGTEGWDEAKRWAQWFDDRQPNKDS